MKTSVRRIQGYSLLLFALVCIAAIGSSEGKKEEAVNPNISRNQLLVNGLQLNYAAFSIDSWGVLVMVSGDPEAPSDYEMPFRIYLKRGAEVIDSGDSAPSKDVTKVEVSKVLKLAKIGDQLIIEPADPTLIKARRVITLRKNYTFFLSAKGDGC
jgi:hypothetical protein